MLTNKTTSPILGIDIGTELVGLALSDGKTVVPLTAAPRAQNQALQHIIQTIQERSIGVVVAGLPLDEHGADTAFCAPIRNFCRRLTKRLPGIELIFVDESFSSVESEERIGAGRRNRARLKSQGVIDSMSACVILERYLQQRNGR